MATQQTWAAVSKQTKAAVEGAIDELARDVARQCRELKALCRGFNLVDELNLTAKQLRAEALQLTSLEARSKADGFIASLERLCL